MSAGDPAHSSSRPTLALVERAVRWCHDREVAVFSFGKSPGERSGRSLRGVCQEADLVFHLAATQHFGLSARRFLDVNVGGTRRVFADAVRSGVERFVLVSSGGIHQNDRGQPVGEESPLRAANVYLRGKIEAERVARDLYRSDPGRLRIVRPGAVYGPGDRSLLELFRSVARGHFVMIGRGTTRVHPVYVDDRVEGLLVAASDFGRGGTLLLSGPDVVSLRDWVRVIARAAGARPPRWSIPAGPVSVAASVCEWACRLRRVAPPLDHRRLAFFLDHRVYDLTRARAVLGYGPAVSIEDGVRRTLDWYRLRSLL